MDKKARSPTIAGPGLQLVEPTPRRAQLDRFVLLTFDVSGAGETDPGQYKLGPGQGGSRH